MTLPSGMRSAALRSGSPDIPAATRAGQAVNKGQLDAAVAGGVGGAAAASGLTDDSGVAGFGPKQSDSNITINTRLLSGASAASAAQTTATAALPKAGGTMTGALVLSGDASASLNPTSKQQLDAEASARSAADATLTTAASAAQTTATAALPKAGGTMTGALVLAGAATVALNPVSLGQLAASIVTDDSGVAGAGPKQSDTTAWLDGRLDQNATDIATNTTAITGKADTAAFVTDSLSDPSGDPTQPQAVWLKWNNLSTKTTLLGVWDAGEPAPGHVYGQGWAPRTVLAVGADGTILGVASGTEAYLTAAQLGLMKEPSASGFAVRTGAGTVANRTIIAASGGKVTIGNGDGISANPTVGLATGTANTLLGFTGSGNPTEIAAGTNVTIASGVINASGGGGTTSPEAAVASIAASYTSGGDTWYSADVLALSTMSLAADTPTYYLHLFDKGFTPTRIELEVSTLGALAVAKIAVYKLETDFSIGAQLCITGDLDCTSTGVKTATVTMSSWFGPGLYWVGVAASVTISIRGATAGNARLRLPRKSGGNGAAIALSRSLTYASALPSTAPALSSLALAVNQPCITMGLP